MPRWCTARLSGGTAGTARRRTSRGHFPLEVDREFDPPNLARWLLRRQAAPAIGSILARRAAVLLVGGFEDEFHDLYEDQVFSFKMFLRHPVFVSSECWDRYRKHPDSTCVRAPEAAHDVARRKFLLFARRHLIRSRCRDPETWWLVQRELGRLPDVANTPPAPVVERLVGNAMRVVSSPVSPVRVHRCGPWAERR